MVVGRGRGIHHPALGDRGAAIADHVAAEDRAGGGDAGRGGADDDGGTGYERGPVRLELTYLVRDQDGSTFTPLRSGRARWSRDAFRRDVRSLRGVRARVIGLDPLIQGKSWPRGDAEDAAKDGADLRILSRVAGESMSE